MPLSPAASALFATVVERVLDPPPELVARLDDAVLGATAPPLRAEPTLAAEVAASTWANVEHWVQAMAADPEGRVPVSLSPEVLAIARDVVRRGLEDVLLTTYHAGQNVAWRFCMEATFAASQDAAVVHEVLDVVSRSMFAFVDDMLAALREVVERERDELTRGTHAERFAAVNLLLEGTPMGERRASERLRYDVSRTHVAAVLWGDVDELGRAAELLARASGAGRPLTVLASATSLWVWLATADVPPAAALDDLPGVRCAFGLPGRGLDGFRRSHLDAVATQRLLFELPDAPRVAGYADVQVVALATADADRAAEFVARTLGGLAGADAALRETLRVYLEEGWSASAAARRLFAHRNTVLNRLARAERLLPRPLAGHGLEVALALEVARWRGDQPSR